MTVSKENRRLGFRWRCRGNGPRGSHRSWKLSPLEGTILNQSHLQFRDLLKVLYNFVNGRSVTECSARFGISSATSVSWYSYFREALAVVGWHDYEKIGKIVL
jgi:hypothetical protein